MFFEKRQDYSPRCTRYKIVTFKNAVVTAGSSSTDGKLEIGIFGRSRLSDGEGLWFEYAREPRYSLNMPGANNSIDVLCFNKEMKVMYLIENTSPQSYLRSLEYPIYTKYILEVPSGFVRRYAVSIGDCVVVRNN